MKCQNCGSKRLEEILWCPKEREEVTEDCNECVNNGPCEEKKDMVICRKCGDRYDV
jgi:uncharacterized protein YbaR (Trm112 family)